MDLELLGRLTIPNEFYQILQQSSDLAREVGCISKPIVERAPAGAMRANVAGPYLESRKVVVNGGWRNAADGIGVVGDGEL